MSETSKNINHGDINAGGSVHIGDLKIQHILGNLQDYQNLEQEIEEARETFNAIALDKQEIRLKLSGTLEAKKEKLENIKKAIEQAFEYISKLTISTERLDQAKALFLEGDISGALEILKDEAIQADYLALQTAKQSEEERHSRRMEEIAEKTKGIAEEWKMKAVLMATRYEEGGWFEKTIGYNEKMLEVDPSVENLFEYAKFLQEHNQYIPATPLYEEALERYQSLAQSNPQAFLPNVAKTLNNLAALSWKKNKLEKAQEDFGEALAIYRLLVESNPQTFLPDLAKTLNNLAILHSTKIEMDQAQEKYDEALAIYRFLVQSNPQTYQSDLAMTLNNLGILHRFKNDLGKAQEEYDGALVIYRSLAKSNPQTFLPYVATTLNNLAILHGDKLEMDQAQEEYEEALAIYRLLAQSNPQAYQPDVAKTLNNLAVFHSDKNELEQAQGEYEEALQIRRTLAKSNPEAFLPYVAGTLNNLALLHSAKNELEQAEREYGEALEIYRTLAKSSPSISLPYVANTASNLALFYQDNQPNREQSLALVKEALKAAMPFGAHQKFVQDSIERAKAVIEGWGLDVEEFLKGKGA